jgi:hypothetical protein
MYNYSVNNELKIKKQNELKTVRKVWDQKIREILLIKWCNIECCVFTDLYKAKELACNLCFNQRVNLQKAPFENNYMLKSWLLLRNSIILYHSLVWK